MRLTEITDYLGFTVSASRKEAEEIQREKTEPKGPKEVYMKWEALSRPQSQFLDVRISRALLMIGIVVGLLLVVMQEFMLILFLASVAFFGYVLSKMSPEKVAYEISSHGISYGDDLYYWDELKQFFFQQSGEFVILNVDTKNGLPGRLFLTIEHKNKDKLKALLEERLHFLQEAPKEMFDGLFDKVRGKFRS
jgi:hypothetical protein